MKKVLAALVALALAGLAAAHARPDPKHRTLKLRAAPAHSLLAVRHGSRSTWLARVDPKTFRYRRGRQLWIGGHSSGWSFSPDRKLLALGDDYFGNVLLVDAARLKELRRIDTGANGPVAATHWLEGRLVAVDAYCCEGGAETTLVWANPRNGEVRSRVSLSGSLAGVARAGSALVLLLGPAEGVGPSRLVVADGAGSTRTAAVERILSGREWEIEGMPTARVARPGLTVDEAGAFAFVVGAGAPVAKVDLATLAVSYHELSTPVSLLGRLDGWLTPAAEAKAAPVGPTRYAAWLGDGLLAVSGYDSEAWTDGSGDLHSRGTPAGLKVIDTRNWSVRTLDPAASRFAVAGGQLLAWSWLWNSTYTGEDTTGMGLTAYGADGAARFHLFGEQPILGVTPLGNRALVRGRANSVVDLKTGRVTRSFTGEAPSLVLAREFSQY